MNMSTRYDWGQICSDLIDLLRLQVIPVGVKLYYSQDEMKAIPKLKHINGDYMPCQIMAQSIHMGFTVGFGAKDIKRGNCSWLMGFKPKDSELSTGKQFKGVWFSTETDAEKHQLATIPLPFDCNRHIVISPLRSKKFDPDVCVIPVTCGQLFLMMSGLLHKNYTPIDTEIVGESSCSMTWLKTIRTGKIGIAPPCFAEMRYGSFSEDKMMLSLTPEDLIRTIDGMKWLSRNGLRYPIPPYGCQCDVGAGVSVSY